MVLSRRAVTRTIVLTWQYTLSTLALCLVVGSTASAATAFVASPLGRRSHVRPSQRPLFPDQRTAARHTAAVVSDSLKVVTAATLTVPNVSLATSSTVPPASRSIPLDVVRALDLVAILELVASHCGTFRGRRALMQTVGQSVAQPHQAERPVNSRQSRFEQFQTVTPTSMSDWGDDDSPLVPETASFRRISFMAHSADEIQAGYQPVQEATRLMESIVSSPFDTNGVSWPPLYAAECKGPLDVTATRVSSRSDDDEWLSFSRGSTQWTLEHVLQAQCVLTKLVSVIQWSRTIATVAPTVAALLNDCTAFERAWRDVLVSITGAVQIVRVRTLVDVSGRSSFQFQLCRQQFPAVGRLQNRLDAALLQTQVNGSTDRATKQHERLVHDVAQLQDEMATLEQSIASDLFAAIYSVRHMVDQGLTAVASLDVVMAKAAFGYAMSTSSFQARCNIGCSPTPNSAGRIRVEQFVHPLLFQSKGETAVPIDLILGEGNNTALVISGSNGGGKSVAMKSFGLVSIMAQLAIPIISSSDQPTVDYFDHVVCSVGDYQNVQDGESTYTALLKRYGTVMEQVGGDSPGAGERRPSFLVLLDELGGGTDEASGGVIGQAVVEKLLSTESCRVVATTHSPRLKTWSFHNGTSIKCAAVLLDRIHPENGDSVYRKPSYKLQYDCIGESYAFGAASRCLPDDVVARASALLDDAQCGTATSTTDSSYMRALTESVELQLTTATERTLVAEEQARDTALLQQAMKSLALAYGDHLSRLQSRVENCYETLQSQNNGDNSVQVLGDTLAELRLVQTRIKSEQELLSERGLKRLPDYYSLSVGETVVVVDDTSEWHGLTATVLASSGGAASMNPNERSTRNEVVVEFSGSAWDFAFGSQNMDVAVAAVDANLVGPTVLQRFQLAIWDYSNTKPSGELSHRSVPESKRALNSLLSKLSTVTTKAKSTPKAKNAGAKTTSAFTSSRDRKAAKRK